MSVFGRLWDWCCARKGHDLIAAGDRAKSEAERALTKSRVQSARVAYHAYRDIRDSERVVQAAQEAVETVTRAEQRREGRKE